MKASSFYPFPTATNDSNLWKKQVWDGIYQHFPTFSQNGCDSASGFKDCQWLLNFDRRDSWWFTHWSNIPHKMAALPKANIAADHQIDRNVGNPFQLSWLMLDTLQICKFLAGERR